MLDVGPGSPHTTHPQGVRREVEERVATHAARSLHLTEIPYHARYARAPDHERYNDWDDFRANCRPTVNRELARRWQVVAAFEEDLNEIRLLLIAAHLRLDRFAALAELPHRQSTTAG